MKNDFSCSQSDGLGAGRERPERRPRPSRRASSRAWSWRPMTALRAAGFVRAVYGGDGGSAGEGAGGGVGDAKSIF